MKNPVAPRTIPHMRFSSGIPPIPGRNTVDCTTLLNITPSSWFFDCVTPHGRMPLGDVQPIFYASEEAV